MKELLVTALGPALVLFVSEMFRYFHAKNERKERFFYEVYPKRLELYEEIIKSLAFVDDIEQAAKADSASEILAVYTQGAKQLLDLSFRCRLFGSGRVAAAVNALAGTQYGQFNFVLEHQEVFNFEATSREFVNAFTEAISAKKGAIVALIQAEAGTDLVDKEIFNIVPALNKKKNKHKEKVDAER